MRPTKESHSYTLISLALAWALSACSTLPPDQSPKAECSLEANLKQFYSPTGELLTTITVGTACPHSWDTPPIFNGGDITTAVNQKFPGLMPDPALCVNAILGYNRQDGLFEPFDPKKHQYQSDRFVTDSLAVVTLPPASAACGTNKLP